MRGGYGSAQVVPLLDLDAIARTPKAFTGLSEITALHVAFNKIGLATFYGPSLTMVGSPTPPAFTTDRLLSVLARNTIGEVPPDSDRLNLIGLAPGHASGRLLGGCLTDFIYTIGTPWELGLDGGARDRGGSDATQGGLPKDKGRLILRSAIPRGRTTEERPPSSARSS